MLSDPKKRKIDSFECMFLKYVKHSVANKFLVFKSDVIEHNTGDKKMLSSLYI